MTEENLDDKTRRAILKGAAATLGVAATGGVASGHPGSGDHGNKNHDHDAVDEFDMSTVGYHSLGRKGSEDPYGSAETPHYGGISELRVKGDLAAVGVLSSHKPTIDRGIAILDVSAYTRAGPNTNLEDAEMSLLSFVPNENGATSVMDVKFSDDGQYLFGTKQPVAALFEAQAGTVPEFRTENDRKVSSASHGGIFAVDIREPGEPEVLDEELLPFGLHNCNHQRIGGNDYVFGVKGPIGAPAAIYVYRFDRSTGELQQVNYWTHDTELAQGEVEDPLDETFPLGDQSGYKYYAHDITVVTDPITQRPYAYLANWNSGARVLDVSDPTDIVEVGQFEMERAHTIAAVPRTVDGKRLFVVGQENPGPDGDTSDKDRRGEDIEGGAGHTGHFYLVDATEVHKDNKSTNLGHASKDTEKTPDSGTTTIEGETRTTELAKWVWRHDAEYDNYTYSAHNIDVIDTTFGGDRRLFVTVGHYHAGTRIVELGHPSGPTPQDEVSASEANYTFQDGTEEDPAPAISEGGIGSGRDLDGDGKDDWKLAEVGWTRTHNNVEKEAKFASLSAATPYHWCAVSENGVIFSSCISTGVYAATLNDPNIPIGTRVLHNADVTRSDDGGVFTAGQTDMIRYEVDTDAEVLVRDRIPDGWTVVGGDATSETDIGQNGTYIEFANSVKPPEHSHGHDHGGSSTRTLFVEAPKGTNPGNSDGYTFGPVEISTDGGETWEAVPDTLDTNLVVGVSTSL